MHDLINTLNNKGVFVHIVESNENPLHTEYLKTSAKQMIEKIKSYIKEPKLRSKKWISTSVLHSDMEEVLRYASAEYFVHNLINQVQFYDKFKDLPSDAIVIELSPHSVFAKVVSETLSKSTYISLMKRGSNDKNLNIFLDSIASLYELGLNPAIECLYPRVEWPVSRNTQSISSLMRWDHTRSIEYRKYPDQFNRNTASDMNFVVNLNQKDMSFYSDYKFDGMTIFPVTGYLMLVWRRLAASMGKAWNEVPVVFEDIEFIKPLYLDELNATKFKVKLLDTLGLK